MRGTFFFGHLHATGKQVGVYPKASLSIYFTGKSRSMIAFYINGVHEGTSRGRGERDVSGVSGKGNMINCGDRGPVLARLMMSRGQA